LRGLCGPAMAPEKDPMMRSALTTGMLVGVWGALWASGGALANEAPKRGGTLNFAVVPEPPTTDCHATTTFAMVHPVAPQYSTLLAFVGPRDNIKIEGDLAKSWEIAKDGLSDTFKLRKSVKFPRRLRLHVRGCQGHLRAHHQPSGGCGLRTQGPAPGHL